MPSRHDGGTTDMHWLVVGRPPGRIPPCLPGSMIPPIVEL